MGHNKSIKEKLIEYLETATEEQLKDYFEVLKKFNESDISAKEFIESNIRHHSVEQNYIIRGHRGSDDRILPYGCKTDKDIIPNVEDIYPNNRF